MKRTLALVALAAIALSFAAAEPFEFPGSGIKLDSPKGWSAEIDDAGESLNITSPDSLVSIVFIPVDSGDLTDALTGAMTQIANDVPDVEFGEPEELKVNGMPAIELAAKGTLAGAAVTISTAVIVNKGPCIVIAYTVQPKGSKHDKVLETFIKSIKKL